MRIFKFEDGAVPQGLGIVYVFAAFCLGIMFCGVHFFLVNAVGIALLTSALVAAAYFIHECSHNTVFNDVAWNVKLGQVMSWVVGSCYTPLNRIVEQHMVHHVERLDNVSYDYRPLLRRYPILALVFRGLEWCYIPAVELWMHFVAMTAAWRLPERAFDGGRVLFVLALRIAFFGLLWVWSPRALFCYAVSYLLFIHVLRFMDCFQHSYDTLVVKNRADLAAHERQSQEYEQANTFSNPLSLDKPHYNWLTLNFSFHNAHHLKPSEPWYRLPALHTEMYGSLGEHTLSFRQLLTNYHRYRVARVLDDLGDEGRGKGDVARFAGALGVSFLTQY